MVSLTFRRSLSTHESDITNLNVRIHTKIPNVSASSPTTIYNEGNFRPRFLATENRTHSCASIHTEIQALGPYQLEDHILKPITRYNLSLTA